MKVYFFFWMAIGVLSWWAYTDYQPLNIIEPNPTFERVQTIFKNRCKECHWAYHWDWTNYEVAFENKDNIRFRVWEVRDMPKGRNISYVERATIKNWIDNGAKETYDD